MMFLIGGHPRRGVEAHLHLKVGDARDRQGIARRTREHEAPAPEIDGRRNARATGVGVQVAAQPAGSLPRRGAVVHDVAGLELRLLRRMVELPGGCVGDRDSVDDRQLPLGVEALEGGEAGVQGQVGNAREGQDLGGVERQTAAERSVAVVLDHGDDGVEPVVPALHVHDHDHPFPGRLGRASRQEPVSEGDADGGHAGVSDEPPSVHAHGSLNSSGNRGSRSRAMPLRETACRPRAPPCRPGPPLERRRTAARPGGWSRDNPRPARGS